MEEKLVKNMPSGKPTDWALIKNVVPEVYELKTREDLKELVYLKQSHRRDVVPRSNKRNNKKKRR